MECICHQPRDQAIKTTKTESLHLMKAFERFLKRLFEGETKEEKTQRIGSIVNTFEIPAEWKKPEKLDRTLMRRTK